MIQLLAHLYLFGSKGSLMGVIISRQGKLWNVAATHIMVGMSVGRTTYTNDSLLRVLPVHGLEWKGETT